MRSNWSIRLKILAMISVPLTALFALWIFATALTVGPAFNLLSARTLQDHVGNPGQVLVGELQRERRLTVEHLSATGPRAAALTEQRAGTDRAAAAFRAAAAGKRAQDVTTPALRTRIAQVLGELDQLRGTRARVDRRDLDAAAGQGLYNEAIDAGFEMFSATASFGDQGIDREIAGLALLGRGREYLNRVDSLLAGATVTGQFTDPVRSQLVQDVGTTRFLLAAGADDLPDARRAGYERMSGGAVFVRLNAMMDTLIGQSRVGAASPVPANDWQSAYVGVNQQLRAFELDSSSSLAARTTPLAVQILLRLGAGGVLGLVALIVAIVVSLKVGRSIVGRLRRLRGEALEMATERLPNVVRRLQRGEVVDVDVETPPLEYGKDEIGQLGQAFNDVQRTAVQSAVEEANVRRGLNEVFLNIARRSQTLLHRQLALLDKMERRETEPQELEDLYRVDHLATRMRRHAEDLVILAGAAPGRGWRNPVSMIDVVRGAISEVEDYKRVDIRSVDSSALLGRAVGDVIHLLAELLENAASFSPPRTRVQVTGQLVPNGYAVEIEDRGLGMAPEAIDEANRRLVEPPDFDPADSARLGLFVVAQLANRHGIRVSLRQSAFGGVTAIVLVPGELVVAAPGPLALATGADKGRERPLVGSGTDDPSRHSLAALQWQGTEELRQLTVPGRPGTINGDGLVQRRRVRAGPVPATAEGLPRRVRQASLAPPLRQAPDELRAEPPAPIRSPEQVRSLMSALQSGTTRGRIDASRYRSEPARDVAGGNQARSEDRPKAEDPGNGALSTGGSFADAATVSFPAIVNQALAGGEVSTRAGQGAAGDRADVPGQEHVIRPDKDA